MSSAVTGVYDSAMQLRNVQDDLRGTGIPSEKIYVDEAVRTIRVLMPEETKPGVVEILQRHGLKSITQ